MRAPITAPAAPTDATTWGPLRVGDKVGLKDTPPFFELQVHTAQRTVGDGYAILRLVRDAASGFIVLAPPPDTLALSPGQPRELWIPLSMIRLIRLH